MRSTSEWIAKHDDARVPPSVRARIFQDHDGICHLTGRKILAGEKWELEHIKALCNGGEHRESNLAPALVAPHREKTKHDRAIKKKTDAMFRMNHGIKKRRRTIPGRRFSGEPIPPRWVD